MPKPTITQSAVEVSLQKMPVNISRYIVFLFVEDDTDHFPANLFQPFFDSRNNRPACCFCLNNENSAVCLARCGKSYRRVAGWRRIDDD